MIDTQQKTQDTKVPAVKMPGEAVTAATVTAAPKEEVKVKTEQK